MRVRVTIVAAKKAISIKYSEGVFVALVIQHAKRMRRIVICSLSGSAKFFPHYLIKWHAFGGKSYRMQMF